MKTLTQHDELLVKPYIDAKVKNALEKIAPVEVSPSTNTYSVGKQLIFNSVLYDVTSAIAIGDTLTVGTNIAVAKNISAQIQTLKNNDDAMLNVLGAKNLLSNNGTTQTINGVTFTVNADKSITVSTDSGGATANAVFIWKFDLEAGSYILSSGRNDTGWRTYCVQVYKANIVDITDYQEGAFTLSAKATKIEGRVRVVNGTVITTPITFYPMVRPASVADDTYVPYAMSNRELTVRTDNKFRRTRKDITNYLDNLVTAIAAQDLESYGYSIGDYFVGASGYKYHLADMDTYYGSYASYAVLNTHHIGIVVQTGATAQWNTSGSTSTGYSGSNLHTYLTGTVLNNIKSDMIALFGGTTGLEHLLSHQKLLTNNVSAWAWVTDQYISALSEVQVYSSRVWGIDGYQTGEANKPLQIFQKFRFNEVFGNIWFWLRDIMSASIACVAGNRGYADRDPASGSAGVVGLILFH